MVILFLFFSYKLLPIPFTCINSSILVNPLCELRYSIIASALDDPIPLKDINSSLVPILSDILLIIISLSGTLKQPNTLVLGQVQVFDIYNILYKFSKEL